MKSLFGTVVLVLACATAAHAQDDDIYDDLDVFAVAFLNDLQPISISQGVEYCGYFGLDANGNIAATQPHRGLPDSCFPAWPNHLELLASYHTHGSYTMDADIEVPSVEDLWGDMEEEVDGYVATPGGRVWLNLFDERITFQLCGRNCIAADPNFRPCQAFLPLEEYTLQGLQARAANDPGYC